MPGKNLCLLSLDGGGVRGLSSLAILQELMETINPQSPPKPCEFFDMIGGTSTGGLIAIMLGRLKMNIGDCIKAYITLMDEVFVKKHHRINWNGTIQGRFDSDTLESAIKKVIVEQGLEENALLKELDAKCKVFVCATAKETSTIKRLASYKSRGTKDLLEVTRIWEAARATSAASSFFDPISIGPYEETFVDGATGANNPVRELWNEAKEVLSCGPLEPDLRCLISIGTGMPKLEAFGNDPLGMGQTLVNIATETEATAQSFHREHSELDDQHCYFRFNVLRGLEDIGLEETKKKNTIISATRNYIERQEVYKQMRACGENLWERPFNPGECLQSLYTSNYEAHKARNPKRVEGTCEWFKIHPKFLQWRQGQKSSILWVTGDPGCGKSVLSSFLVDELKTTPSDVVCHFFFKDDNETQKTSALGLSALLHQLFTARPQLITYAKPAFLAKGGKFVQETSCLWQILLGAASKFRHGRIICILDGLDECVESSRRELIQQLSTTFSDADLRPLKVLLTSRPYATLERLFRSLSTIRLKAEDEITAISQDIEKVVKAKVSDLGKSRDLADATRVKLESDLIHNADRTFLWVSLILETMESLPSVTYKAVSKSLETIPTTLDSLYESILQQSPDQEDMRRLLHIVTSATRPLTLSEINIALRISEEDLTCNDLDLEPNIEDTIKRLCGPFVRIIDFKIYLVHQTAKVFLIKKTSTGTLDNATWKHSLDPATANAVLARSCVRYLLFSDWDSENWSSDGNMYQKFHGTSSQLTEPFSDEGKPLAFYGYAASNYYIHLQRMCNHDEAELDLGLRKSVIQLCDTQSGRFWQWFRFVREPGDAPIHWAARVGSRLCIEAFLSITDIQLNMENSKKQTALGIAAANGHNDVIEALLIPKSIRYILGDSSNLCALAVAAGAGHESAVRILHNLGLSINSAYPDLPLKLACKGGHESVVRYLIASGADVDKLDWESSTSALSAAAERGFDAIVTLLLNAKVDLAGIGPNQKALVEAARNGHLTTVELLVARGADVNPNVQYDNSRPLSGAAERGHSAIVRFLLKNGANVKEDTMPLVQAVKGGHQKVAELLLEYGAENHDLALLEAAAEGHNAMVDLLLKGKTQLTLQQFDLALRRAIFAGHDTATKLFKNKIEISIFTDRWTCLPLACLCKRADLITLHINSGTMVNAKDNWQLTPLLAAVISQDFAVVKMLLDHQADPNICCELEKSTLFRKGEDLSPEFDKFVITQLLRKSSSRRTTSSGLDTLERLERLERLDTLERLDMRDTFERLERLDTLERLERLDTLNTLNTLDMFDELDMLDGLDRLNELERLKRLDRLDGPDGLDIVFEERVSKFKTYRELTRHGNTTPLSCAVLLKNKAIIQLLLQKGSDVWSPHLKVSILGLAKEGMLDWLIRVMFDNDRDHTYDVNESDPNGGLTALHWALSSTMLGLVKFLLAKGAKVDIADSQGRTPLHYATSVGIPEMVDLLLAKYDEIAVQDSRDKMPLRDTSPGRDLSAAERLKSKKEYVSSRDQQGKTPLHDASAKGHLEVVVFLLSKGADVNVRDKWDRTPLYEAIEAPLDEAIEAPLDNTTKRAQQEDDEEAKAEREKKSHERRLEVVKALVFQGSDLTIRDREGFTPLEFAQRCHRSDLGDFLARVQRSGCNILEQDAIQKAYEQYLERVPAKDTMSSHEKSSWMANDSPLLEYDDDSFWVSDGEEESTDD